MCRVRVLPSVRCVRHAAAASQFIVCSIRRASQVSGGVALHHKQAAAHIAAPALTRLSLLPMPPSPVVVPPLAAVGGYLVIVTQLHEETNDDDLTDAFSDFGHVSTLHLNLDRRTGYVKGYALLEYAREEEARRAVEEGDGMVVMERQVKVDWALKPGSGEAGGAEQGRGGVRDGAGGAGGGGSGGVGRSRTVIRRDYREIDRGRGRDVDRDSARNSRQ